MNKKKLWLFLALVIGGPSCSAPSKSNDTSPRKATAQVTPRIVEYAPGLRIDYRVPQVEIDAQVILREGAIELFLYSKAPTPKEHESILKTLVPAKRIFEALGLIGLTPGQPMRYFHETGKVRMPTGDPVEVSVKYESAGRRAEDTANDWMLDAQKKTTMQPTHWLFTGSDQLEDGAFGADVEGTIITVVDFPTSLLSLPATHTSSDSDLWLKANTDRIPPVGTKVIVLLRKPRTAS